LTKKFKGDISIFLFKRRGDRRLCASSSAG
jgi:hypothetical protein